MKENTQDIKILNDINDIFLDSFFKNGFTLEKLKEAKEIKIVNTSLGAFNNILQKIKANITVKFYNNDNYYIYKDGNVIECCLHNKKTYHEYDKNGNETFFKEVTQYPDYTYTYWSKTKYNEKNMITKRENSDNEFEIFKYDKFDNILEYKNNEYHKINVYGYINDISLLKYVKINGEIIYDYEYVFINDRPRIKKFIDNKNNKVIVYDYDKNGNKIYECDETGFNTEYKYDDNNNLIYCKRSNNKNIIKMEIVK